MPYVQLKNLKIHYLEKGSGKPLFLLHGLGNNAKSWEMQLNSLSNHFRVIAWDAPGYGLSSDPNPEFKDFSEFSTVLNEILNKLNLKSIHLLGHSMGAAIAIDFSYRFPERVEKLILADTPRGAAVISEDENKEKLNNRLHAINVEGSQVLAKKRTKHLFSEYASDELIQKAEKIMAEVRGPGYRSVSYSLYHLDQTELFPKLTPPTLLICGELDKITPVEDTKYVHENIPNSELVIIPKTGHLCYMEDPNLFNQAVQNFILKK